MPNGVASDLAGNPLAAFSRRLDALPGDATRDRRVNVLDEWDIRNRVGRSTASPGAGSRAYSPFADVNGSGQVDVIDYALARMRLMSALPPVTTATALFGVRPASGPPLPRGR